MTSHHPISTFIDQKVSWLSNSIQNDDVAMTSRIRLARNLPQIPFPVTTHIEALNEVRDLILKAIQKSSFSENLIYFDMDLLSSLEKTFLLERRLVSKEFIDKAKGTGLFVKPDESASIMINEEDHIQFQTVLPGSQIQKCWNEILLLHNELGNYISYAFDDKLGFITASPRNIGTGMRISVMLHLPGLVLCEQIDQIIRASSKLKFTIHGIMGDKTENIGNLFQISNQSTLGESEEQIIERLDKFIKRIINLEKNARQMLLENKKYSLLNHIGQAYGLLKHSYLLSYRTVTANLSPLRMGVDLGLFNSVNVQTVNELFIWSQPAHLQYYTKSRDSLDDQEITRAKMVRDRLRCEDSTHHL